MEDLEVSEFKCHGGIENILMGPWRVFFNMKSWPFRAAPDNSPAWGKRWKAFGMMSFPKHTW